MKEKLVGCIASTVLLATVFAGPVTGSDERRGGNHGCDAAEGTFFSSDFFDPDRISIGHLVSSTGFPATEQRTLRAINFNPDEMGPDSQLSCGKTSPDKWSQVISQLGPGDDSVRLDAKGVPPEGENVYSPVPKGIDSLLKGGGGDDTIRGHKGFDEISGNGGDDVIKAADGIRDIVKCGPGDDKADVDSKDDVSGCEKRT